MSLTSLTDIDLPKNGSKGSSLRVYDLYVDGSIIPSPGGSITPAALQPQINNSRIETPGNNKLNIYGLRHGPEGDSEIVVGLSANEIYMHDAVFDNTIATNVSGVQIESNNGNIELAADQLVDIKGTATSGDTINIGDVSGNTIRTNVSGGIFLESDLNITSIVPSSSPQTSYSQNSTKVTINAGNSGTTGTSIDLNKTGVLQIKSSDVGIPQNNIELTLDSTQTGGRANLLLTDTANDEKSELYLDANTARISNYSLPGTYYSYRVFNENHFIDNLIIDPSPTAHQMLYINQATGQIYRANKPSSVSGVTLVGNPIHQFVTGGDGELDFRGMISPNNTITFNPTSTNIEMEAIQPGAMQPTTLGTAYGYQDTGSLLNNLGYDNNSQLTRGNVIAQGVPTSLTGDKSNVIASVNTLQATNNITNSNVIVSGDGSELQTVDRSTIIGQGFSNPNDFNNCIYIGDMLNTTPNNYSMCLNTNYYGSPIQMAKESAYFGFGKNNLTLNNGECHFDYGAPNLYYHDLATGTSSNVLYYDNTNGKITYDVPANATQIQHQVPDTTHGGNIISVIGNSSESSKITCDDTSVGIKVESGTELLLASPDFITLSCAGSITELLIGPTGATLYGNTQIELQAGLVLITVGSGFQFQGLPAGPIYDWYLQYGPSGQVGWRSLYFQRKGTVVNISVPSGTAINTVYGSTNIIQAISFTNGSQIKGEYSLTNYSDTTTQSRLNLPDGSFVSLPTASDGTLDITCTLRSILGSTGTWVYIIQFGLIGGGLSRVKGTFTRGTGLNYPFSLQTEMITTANLTLDYAIVNVERP